MQINKIHFMYHPVCWVSGMNGDEPPPGVDKAGYLACLRWEGEVNERQYRLIDSMQADEALVIFPIGTGPAMLALEDYARHALGPRCIIVKLQALNAPASWAGLPHPIARFLDDEKLQDRAEFLRGVPPAIQDELVAEIREACQLHGYDWNLATLKVVYYNRLAAEEIRATFTKRGLTFDANTVESQSFGEGFEQCAATWKSMLVHYLGLRKPTLNNFNLSVSGAQFLVQAKLREQLLLGHETQLFLWEGEDGPIGFYLRARCRLKDPQYFASFKLPQGKVEVWDLSQKRWPGEDWPFKAGDGAFEVPVHNSIRRDASDEIAYVIGRRCDFEEFRECLAGAEITCKG